LIEPDQAIFLDGGTTTLQVAKHIAPDHSITVVTNALNVAAVLLERGVHTIVTGGTILEKTGSMIGPIALHSLSSMAFDQVFLGTAGVTAEHGFSNSNSFEAELKRFVMGRSGKVNIVADSSKLGSRFLHSFAGLKDIHRFITDIAPPAAFAEIAQTEGVEVIASEM
jgi:DeoR/GlpR family transcriptional regulator of sugar metabolism